METEKSALRGIKLAAVICLAAFTGFATGFLAADDKENPGKEMSADLSDFLETRMTGYDYINPLLECDIGEEMISSEIRIFKNALEDFIGNENGKYSITKTAVYFRDLNNGPWFGINEKEEFSPASLLKVPLLMYVMKKAEENQEVLGKKITIPATPDYSDQYIKPSKTVAKGEVYTVEDLLTRMIVYSDNYVQNLIFESVGEDDAGRMYSDIGLDLPNFEKGENYMSVKFYASFFRMLYNASYLTKDDSEKALRLLADIDFRGGITGGVPNGIKVAHKFGERTITSTGEKQLHDCGIIYFPKHPYLLCIMNRGATYEDMASFMGKISSFVYENISKQYE